MHPYVKNSNVASNLYGTFLSLFYTLKIGMESAKDTVYGVGEKKQKQINKVLETFDLSIKNGVKHELLVNLINLLIKEDVELEREKTVLRKLGRLKISELPRLRRKKSEDIAVKNFLNRHFETFEQLIEIGVRDAALHLKKGEGEDFWLIKNTLDNFIKKELNN